MTSYGHYEYGDRYLVQNACLPHHPTSAALSAPPGMSTSLPASMEYHYSLRDSYSSPRTLAPHPGYLPHFQPHDYNHDHMYAISSTSTSARGRSDSAASTASVSYSVGSPRTTPTSPHLLSGAGSQYQATHTGNTIFTEELALPDRTQLPPSQIKQEPTSSQNDPGKSSTTTKTSPNDETYCPHANCRDENGNPTRFFSRKADVTRHYKSCHDIKYLDCPKLRCGRKGTQGFTRKDHLTEHLRGFHMEEIEKRVVLKKAEPRKDAANEDDNSPATTPVATTPTEAAIEITTRSRGPSFAKKGGKLFKQEQHSPSLEDVEENFQMDEACRRRQTTMRARRASSNKVKVESNLPYPPRKPGKNSPEVKEAKVSYHLSTSPVYTTSLEVPHPPLYAMTQTMANPYTTGHLVSPMYATHHGMDHYFGPSSMPESYHSLPSHPISRYHDQQHTLDDFHYQ